MFVVSRCFNTLIDPASPNKATVSGLDCAWNDFLSLVVSDPHSFSMMTSFSCYHLQSGKCMMPSVSVLTRIIPDM